MASLVTVEEIRAAADRLTGVIVRTPLVPFPETAPRLLVKPESLQPTGSFKLRGAYTAIMASAQAARQHGVVAHSSGNHGHAVAYAAALLGVRAVVVVPIAFTGEHIETLQEIDILYREQAQKQGIVHFARAQTVGTHPAFIRALADLAEGAARAKGWVH